MSQRHNIHDLACETADFILTRCHREGMEVGNASLALMSATAGWISSYLRCRFPRGAPAATIESICRDFRLTLLANLRDTGSLPPELAAEYDAAVEKSRSKNVEH